MAADALDIRMARLEGAYEQINERLGAIEQGIADLRRQTVTQFYWLLTFVLGSILVPLLHDLVR